MADEPLIVQSSLPGIVDKNIIDLSPIDRLSNDYEDIESAIKPR